MNGPRFSPNLCKQEKATTTTIIIIIIIIIITIIIAREGFVRLGLGDELVLL